MTDKQFEIEEQKLRDEGYYRTRKCDCTPEQIKRAKELSCIGMINSILAYQYTNDAKYVLEREENAYRNYLEEYTQELGRERVIELIQGQIDSIKCIRKNIYTDCEGLSYNGIEWNE